MFWAQSPEERECRRESENSGPVRCLASGQMGFVPSDESKYNTQKYICQVFCQKIFLGYIFIGFLGIYTNDSRLNLFKPVNIIKVLDWEAEYP